MAETADRHWWFVARRRILTELIRRRIRLPENARILEVGCGTGHNLPMLSQFGRVDATELDDAARAMATKRLGRPVLNARLPALTGIDGTYDLIAVLDVLEHVEDDLGALEALASRLKPAGSILVTVPGAPWMWSAHDVAHHHFRRYSQRDLCELAAKAGVSIDFLTPFNSILYPLVALRRLIAKASTIDRADDAMPSAPLNSILAKVMGFEATAIGRIPLPVGVSLAAIVSKSDK